MEGTTDAQSDSSLEVGDHYRIWSQGFIWAWSSKGAYLQLFVLDDRHFKNLKMNEKMYLGTIEQDAFKLLCCNSIRQAASYSISRKRSKFLSLPSVQASSSRVRSSTIHRLSRKVILKSIRVYIVLCHPRFCTPSGGSRIKTYFRHSKGLHERKKRKAKKEGPSRQKT